jgi:hypothetical protein
LRVKSAPIFTSSSTRAGPSRHTASTALVVRKNKMDKHEQHKVSCWPG